MTLNHNIVLNILEYFHPKQIYQGKDALNTLSKQLHGKLQGRYIN